jgi:hypothetical protein
VAHRLGLSRAVVRRAERRGLRALRQIGRGGCLAASRSESADAAAGLSAASAPVPERVLSAGGGELDGGPQGGNTGSGGGGAEHDEAVGASARDGVAGISATLPAPASGALDGPGPLLLVILLALVAGSAVLFARRRGEWSPWARWLAPPLPIMSAIAAAPEREQPRPGSTALPLVGTPERQHEPPVRVRPPDPHRTWLAAVVRSGTGLAVVARAAADEPGVVLATSGSVEHLEAALLAAGWQPIPAGGASQTKRFAWIVTAPASSDAWSADTDEVWRCEIKWQPGYRSSSFRAVMYAPAQRRGTTLGRSGTFRWLMMGDPDPDDGRSVEEVRWLADRLRSAGWEPAGRGGRWYSLRFAWRHEDPPPDSLEPAPADGAQ